MAGALVLLALVAAPVPLLPPHRLAEAVQGVGANWKAAYLVAALGLQAVFYGALGVLAVFATGAPTTMQGRLLQAVLTPLVVVGIALAIRSMRAGHFPVWANTVVPVLACVVGVSVGLGLMQKSGRMALLVATPVIAAVLWAWLARPSSALLTATEAQLERLAALGDHLPAGDERFARLLEAAMATPTEGSASAVDHNRAAMLALGIAMGDARLARLVGLDHDAALVSRATQAADGATLRGRPDWAKHFSLSAALSVMEHPLVSDAAGLMKEQVDALAQGTGFSFADLAADRAGIRLAIAATRSDSAAVALQDRLRAGFAVDDFFPAVADLPEDLTVEQFRREYDAIGAPRYRELIARIDARLDSCPGLR